MSLQSAQTAALSLIVLVGCHPWFRCGPGAPEGQVPQIVTPDGALYRPRTPSWVPLIDACMARGGQRTECIDALPAEERARLEAWEARQAEIRRRQLRDRSSPQDPRFGTVPR